MSSPVGAFLPHLQSGQVRLWRCRASSATTSCPTCRPTATRLPHHRREWYGFFCPARRSRRPSRVPPLPAARPVVPDCVKGLGQFGRRPRIHPQALSEMLVADSKEWRSLIKTVGFTAES